ncbi:cyclophilin-like domain containing protein [Babesia gibsoni]|uniref:peptidylprolyl isomerase n=1 Tax=Babesia gibsoni TaxID=33632 RepID=A0AAD8PF75_BABGI|nr:cyclophilin-like domain containing protein [Babesia gibsoni]
MASPIDLTGDSGVVKTILVESPNGEIPAEGHQVEIHYVGKLESGVVFDSSYDRDSTFKFVIGGMVLVKGCEIAIGSMRVGEKAMIVIQPSYGYGETGSGKHIPPNAVLHFEVELINTRPQPRNKSDMSTDEKIQASVDCKESGNSKFLRGEYWAAVTMYKEGVNYLSERDEWAEEPRKTSDLIKLQCHLNLSNCYIKLEKYDFAEDNATEALRIDANNVKGLYRRALARFNLKSYSDALQDLAKLIKSNPKNADAVKLYHLAKVKHSENSQIQKKHYGSVFKGLSLYEDKKGLRQLKDMPHVYLDVTIGEKMYKLVIALFEDTVPKTAKNFKQLCDESAEFNYKGNKFHRLIKGFMIQGGDITKGDGTGGMSIYGESFEDEAFTDTHSERGLLSMANCGPNTNSSQFFITFVPTPHLDGRHVVFGKVVEGLDVLSKFEHVETGEQDRPNVDITIVGCGSM